MRFNQDAWRQFGVTFEQDTAGYWSWHETTDGGEDTGAFSPPFHSLEACESDVIACYGSPI